MGLESWIKLAGPALQICKDDSLWDQLLVIDFVFDLPLSSKISEVEVRWVSVTVWRFFYHKSLSPRTDSEKRCRPSVEWRPWLHWWVYIKRVVKFRLCHKLRLTVAYAGFIETLTWIHLIRACPKFDYVFTAAHNKVCTKKVNKLYLLWFIYLKQPLFFTWKREKTFLIPFTQASYMRENQKLLVHLDRGTLLRVSFPLLERIIWGILEQLFYAGRFQHQCGDQGTMPTYSHWELIAKLVLYRGSHTISW